MSLRLYYTDSTLRAFDATVRACQMIDGRAHVVLDRTAFYPTSGGQPFDTGRLAGAAVIDVIDREDGEITHLLDAALEVGASVTGEIDWRRRLDHMQQHTGQHVLSAAFDRRFGVRTTSFHMGGDVSTIDLGREVSADEIAQAEADANEVVWDDRPVTIRFVTADEASRLPLRKEPVRAGELRLVEVANFDLSACGGTHVARTGTIGIIAVSAWERVKGATRVSFVCGRRALESHHRLRDVVQRATRVVSVTPAALPDAMQRLQQEARDAEKRAARLQEELARYRAAALRDAAETVGPLRVVFSTEPGADAAVLKSLASRIVETPGLVAVLTGDAQPLPIVIARSADVALDASALMRLMVQRCNGRGGGRPELSQGGLAARAEDVMAEIRRALP
jgi:alanyl-tRNA synthetase